jgi:hypothetical protein
MRGIQRGMEGKKERKVEIEGEEGEERRMT